MVQKMVYVNRGYIFKEEKTIAKLYICLLTVRMITPLSFLTGIVGAGATYFDLIIHCIGLFLMIFSSRGVIQLGSNGHLVKHFIGMIVYLNISSIIMAIILHEKLGTIDGEDTFTAIFGMLIYYTQYIFMIIYNNHIMQMFTIEEIKKIFDNIIKFLLILGYIQIAICLNIGGVSAVYDELNILGIFCPATYISTIMRIPLVGAEPASAGMLIGTFVLPFLLSNMIKEKASIKKIIYVILWLPIIYFTKSSTCYILVLLNIIIFCILYMKYSMVSPQKVVLIGIIAIISLTMIFVLLGGVAESEFVKQIEYLLFNKISDRNNESTVTRTIPTYINMRIFAEYPLTGVGNGNQGFFYAQYYPAWGTISRNTFNEIRGVADGGVFIPSLFSGYGIIGTSIFALYFYKLFRFAKKNREKLENMYFMFVIAFFAFLFNGFQGDNIGCYYIWFVMCIPFMNRCLNAGRKEVDR